MSGVPDLFENTEDVVPFLPAGLLWDLFEVDLFPPWAFLFVPEAFPTTVADIDWDT